MAKLVFVEGVSGVGKSTMVRMLAEELRAQGRRTEAYAEFDFRNPIDFYCTAYLPKEEFERLCDKYGAETLAKHTIFAGDARLVRYYDEDTPLFDEPLLSELAEREFCYEPRFPVSLEAYSEAYRHVWQDFSRRLDDEWEFILFDGSLLHHPLNDMMRNYGADADQMFSHVKGLLDALEGTQRQIFYMETKDLSGQLTRAWAKRGQGAPDRREIAFWQKRYENDQAMLAQIGEEYCTLDVSDGGWETARERILAELMEE